MTTTNTETLTLYANPFLYNGSRYVFYQNGRDYETWLRETSPEIDTKVVYFKSLTEEIEINSPVKDMTKFTYGKISNAGRFYYIFIDRITTDQHGKSYVSFSVDWWASEWANIHPTKAHLIRKPTKPGYMAQPWTPLNVSSDMVGIVTDYCVMASYIPSEDKSKSYISTIILRGNENTLKMVEEGYWYQQLGIAGSDVKDCFVVPLFSYETFSVDSNEQVILTIDFNITGETSSTDILTFVEWLRDGHYAYDNSLTVKQNIEKYYLDKYFYNKDDRNYYVIQYDIDVPIYNYKFVEISNPAENYKFVNRAITGYKNEDGDLVLYQFLQTQFTDSEENFWSSSKTLDVSFTSTEIKKEGIIDWDGDIVWECPYGITVEGFDVTLNVGLSHILLQFLPSSDNLLSDKLTGKGFTYSCKHPPLFTDSYQEYVLKNRDYDIAMRQIQSDRQIWHAGVSTAENIGFGIAFGQEKGGVAAGIGGLLETAGTFAINKHFDPMIQQQYDYRYSRMTDQVTLIGDSLTNIYRNPQLSKYELNMDIATQERMNNDIQVNGYVCDETTSSLEELFTVGAIVQTDMVVVEGVCCLDAKQQTVYRLGNGVEFK